MENRKKITFVTGSRADYGIMERFLLLLQKDEEIDLTILVTGALLDHTFGYQVEMVRRAGFFIGAEIDIPINTTSNVGIIQSMSVAMEKFSLYFSNADTDLLIILGDRYEMLSVAVAAAMQRIPILHIHGGEATFGNYDEFIRHAITKMSLYHFTSTEEYRRRVIQLGEHPNRVFCVGALGAENCMYIDEKNVPKEVRAICKEKYFVILFHPETLTNVDISVQVGELLSALEAFEGIKFVFLGSNADTHSDIVRNIIDRFVNSHTEAVYFENLHKDAYHFMLKHTICLIGNSSSGIIEAPSLGIYSINIGDRQKGRIRGNSIIDTACKCQEIRQAIYKVMNQHKPIEIENPYYKKDSVALYYTTIKRLLCRLEMDRREPKSFYDLDKRFTNL